MNKLLVVFAMTGMIGAASAAELSTNGNGAAGRSVDTGYDSKNRTVGYTLTQSTDPATIIPANSASCNAGGPHTINSYMRRFDLDGAHGLSSAIKVTSVDYGVESALGATGSQPISINLYSIANADPLLFANLITVATLDTTIADTSLSIANAVVGGVIDPLTDDLIVEIYAPEGVTPGNIFFLGSNDAGQTAPSFLAAADCGIFEPTDTAAIGFPQMQIVMTVNAEQAASFIRIGTLNEAPAPATCETAEHEGRMIVDSANSKLYFCSAVGWQSLPNP